MFIIFVIIYKVDFEDADFGVDLVGFEIMFFKSLSLFVVLS